MGMFALFGIPSSLPGLVWDSQRGAGGTWALWEAAVTPIPSSGVAVVQLGGKVRIPVHPAGMWFTPSMSFGQGG